MALIQVAARPKKLAVLMWSRMGNVQCAQFCIMWFAVSYCMYRIIFTGYKTLKHIIDVIFSDT